MDATGGRRRGFRWHRLALLAVLITAVPVSSAQARSAYVANFGLATASVFDTQTNLASPTTIGVGSKPQEIAISPDGTRAYVANAGAGTVSVIDTQTNQTVGGAIGVGVFPYAIAITPDGRHAYVVNNGSKSVSVIDTSTNQVVGSPIETLDPNPIAIAITPDGRHAYVVNNDAQSVSVIDTQTNQIIGTPIGVGKNPVGIAITPDGRRAYVVNEGSVSVIDTGTNSTVGPAIVVPAGGEWIAITPDGRHAYVPASTNKVVVIDTQANQASATTIGVGTEPEGIAIAPDGRHAYVTNTGSADVSVIDTQTNQAAAMTIGVGTHPTGIAVTPDQGPVASFKETASRPGVRVPIDASGSSDPDGTIAGYAWNFGDGHSASDGGARPAHAYAKPGRYQVTLTVTDQEGCSTAFVFTGQTAYCNGGPRASQARTVHVAYPGVRVRCPHRAGPGGCSFSVKAVTKRRRGKPESAVARTKVKAGKAAVVSLKPNRAYRAKLAVAHKILVEVTTRIGGSSRTAFTRLKIVQ
jgi:YVTN family beta-propeller protein